MSTYPPGVTGGEYEIAGPDYEQEFDEYPCPKCGDKLMEQGYGRNRWVVCVGCESSYDLEVE